MNLAELGMCITNLSKESIGLNGYEYGKQVAELEHMGDLPEIPIIMGLNYGIREFLLPATMRVERETEQRLDKPYSYAALLRDFTSSITPLIIGGGTAALTQNAGVALTSMLIAKLVANAIVHIETNRSIRH